MDKTKLEDLIINLKELINLRFNKVDNEIRLFIDNLKLDKLNGEITINIQLVIDESLLQSLKEITDNLKNNLIITQSRTELTNKTQQEERKISSPCKVKK